MGRRPEGRRIPRHDLACQVAGVSTSSYYAWAAEAIHGASAAQWEQAHLINEIVSIHRDTDAHLRGPAHRPSWRTWAGWSTTRRRSA